MENAEEILQCLDEFSKVKPKDIPRELEEYLCFVAKTGDPVYQWPLIKCLFREKLINVITEFYETCPSVEIPPCPNVDTFNYDSMKTFILEKLDTFAAAPFTVQRICELLTTPRKEYNRIDKYMRALEKNILVVSTREPGNRRTTENGESIVNGLESEHNVSQEIINSDVNVEVEMDDVATVWPKMETNNANPNLEPSEESQNQPEKIVQDTLVSESKDTENIACSSTINRPLGYMGYTPNITDLIIEPPTVETPVPIIENNTTAPAENISVTSIVSQDIAEQPHQEEINTPIYVETSKIDTPIYLGTTENGDSVYRVKYEPYVETDYLALPEPDVTVYVEPPAEPKPEEIIVTKEEPEEPVTTVAQPESSSDVKFYSNSTTETAITSSDEVPSNSSDVVTEETVVTSEDQVSESNIDCVVSQTEITEEILPDKLEKSVTPVLETVTEVVEPESSSAEPVPESMEVDETNVEENREAEVTKPLVEVPSEEVKTE